MSDRPASAVHAWAEPIVIPTYPAMPPDRNPMFLEKRVYQGSSGRVYPNPFTDRVSDDKVDRTWQAVHLENEYVRLMILPEIGGRIQIGQDKSNGYDFLYRQQVIKPALVGLLGPWISGGVEFNWPQHHRPSTFMPVDWTIEEDSDGGRTVWLSEHEPMNRMKGMVGIRLRPGSSLIEVTARLANRTPHVQTFLWWTNIAVRVHDRYQSFFPPDVSHVADHAKRAMSRFPIARGAYYGVDYGARPKAEADLSWYRNIPVPTSYMAMDSEHDFFGGYDHVAEAGLVHVADHHVSPGKKQWTWGNHEFGHAWDRNLTDEDGPYVELMAGVYTDNQPDFSFLAPYETRRFSQFLYPIQRIGPVQQATVDAAISLRVEDGRALVGACATASFPGARVRLSGPTGPLLDRRVDLAPDAPFLDSADLPSGVAETDLELTVCTQDGRMLVAYRPLPRIEAPLPDPASEPPLPEAVQTIEELYLTGLHLDQYRHATRAPDPYWREGLRRDPDDSRCNTALGVWHLRRGELDVAERHLRRAIARLARRNPNPYDGEPFYQLGLALRYQERFDEAYDAFFKATWSQAWQGAAFHALAQIDCRRSDWRRALGYLGQALDANATHASARNLKAAVLRRLGALEAAATVARATLEADPLDVWAWEERRLARLALGLGLELGSRADGAGSDRLLPRRDDIQTHLDLALDYAGAGLWPEAIGVLDRLLDPMDPAAPISPLVHYYLGWLHDRAGNSAAAAAHYRLAGRMPADYCFPARLEEIAILRGARAANPADARVSYYLGNLLYDRRRYDEAIAEWERARSLDPSFPTVQRNLGIAEFNVRHRPRRARAAYLAAFRADPRDGRILYELDQLLKRLNEDPSRRLARLEAHRSLLDERDDLGTAYATLLNQCGHSREALAYLLGRRFHPWEGGEGLVSGQYVTARLRLARAALQAGRAAEAVAHLEAALRYPENLGEGRHLLAPANEVYHELGCTLHAAGERDRAVEAWRRAAEPVPDPAGVSAATFFRALALRALGDEPAAVRLLHEFGADVRRQARREVRIDYFATSLPTFLLFDDDLTRRNEIECRYLAGLAKLGLGQRRAARAAFQLVLVLDVNHLAAADALERAIDRR